MKTHRWLGGLALGVALLLGACAPPNQGGQSSPSEPASQAESSAPSPSADPSGTPVPQESYGY
jgi:hypothetical protein